MAIATVENIEGLYNEIVDDDDFILEESQRTNIYERMKHRDAHIAACWASRTTPIASAEWQITSESQDQKDTLTEHLKNFPDWQQYNMALLDAVFRGFCGVEWELNEPGADSLVREWLNIDQDNLTFKASGEPRLITANQPYDGVKMPFPQFHVLSWGERFHGRRRGKGIGQGLFWAWFFKHKGYKFWGRALEQFGTPTLWGKLAGGNQESRRKRWLKILRDYVAGSGIVTDKDEEIETVGNVSQVGASHQAFEEFFNAEISKRVLGQTLTTEQGQRGSQALGKVHGAIREDILTSDAMWLSNVHTQNTLAGMGLLLFGDAYKKATFQFLFDDPEQAALDTKRLLDLKTLKIPMRTEDVYQLAHVPEPAKGDETYEWPEAVPFGAPPGAPPAPGEKPETKPGDPSNPPTQDDKDEFSEASRLRRAKKDQQQVEDLEVASIFDAVRRARKNGFGGFAKRIQKKN